MNESRELLSRTSPYLGHLNRGAHPFPSRFVYALNLDRQITQRQEFLVVTRTWYSDPRNWVVDVVLSAVGHLDLQNKGVAMLELSLRLNGLRNVDETVTGSPDEPFVIP